MKRGTYIRTPEMNKRTSESVSGEKNGFFGKKHTEETKQKMRLSHLGKNKPYIQGDKHGMWKGGVDYNTWHLKAWKLFGKNECEMCKITNKLHLEKFKVRLHMHCNTHNYSILTEDNWKCLCVKCHGEID